jgi:hypothetical protein
MRWGHFTIVYGGKRLAKAMAAIANNTISATICLEFARRPPVIAAAMFMLTKKFAACGKTQLSIA